MNPRWYLFFKLAAVFALWVSGGFGVGAQTNVGAIHGVVTDPSKAVVTGARPPRGGGLLAHRPGRGNAAPLLHCGRRDGLWGAYRRTDP